MFVWECLKTEGTPLGMCMERFMFGSCCAHDLDNNMVPSRPSMMMINSSSNQSTSIFNNSITASFTLPPLLNTTTSTVTESSVSDETTVFPLLSSNVATPLKHHSSSSQPPPSHYIELNQIGAASTTSPVSSSAATTLISSVAPYANYTEVTTTIPMSLPATTPVTQPTIMKTTKSGSVSVKTTTTKTRPKTPQRRTTTTSRPLSPAPSTTETTAGYFSSTESLQLPPPIKNVSSDTLQNASSTLLHHSQMLESIASSVIATANLSSIPLSISNAQPINNSTMANQTIALPSANVIISLAKEPTVVPVLNLNENINQTDYAYNLTTTTVVLLQNLTSSLSTTALPFLNTTTQVVTEISSTSTMSPILNVSVTLSTLSAHNINTTSTSIVITSERPIMAVTSLPISSPNVGKKNNLFSLASFTLKKEKPLKFTTFMFLKQISSILKFNYAFIKIFLKIGKCL